MNELTNFAGGPECEPPKACRPVTPRERLLSKKADYEARLARVNEAIQFLDENPVFDKGFMLITQAL